MRSGVLRRVLRIRSAQIALVILLGIAVLVVFGSSIAPQDPLHQDVARLLQGPSGAHWLGTDYLGRDVLSRLVAGSRLSVLTAVEAVAAALVVGALPGLASVFFGRWFDFIANRLTDAIMTLPTLVFAIAFTAVLGNRMTPVMLAVGFLISPYFFRVTRAAALQYAQEPYVDAARLFGVSRVRVVGTHVVGKVLPTVLVTAATALAGALLTVSSLTFLGIGVVPPAPTWGGVLSSDLNFLSQLPWAPLAPAALIMLTAGSLNILADALRDTIGTSGPPVVRAGAITDQEVDRVDEHPAA
ncbi:MAG: binding-protein-dependent transport system inner rane component [Pseudonocardiales bacterium]|nr:binding-protein-dependent transport system inner rane component [Pseudonocardiales bacterium]